MFSALLPVNLGFHVAIVIAKVRVGVPSCVTVSRALTVPASAVGAVAQLSRAARRCGRGGQRRPSGAVCWGRGMVKPFSIEGAP